MQATRFHHVAAAALVAGMAMTASACGSTNDGNTAKVSSTTAAEPATSAPGTTATTAKPAGCGSWSKGVVGQSAALTQPDKNGIFIWQDGFGWHMRTRASGTAPMTYSGTITGSNDLGKVTPTPAPGGATAEISGNTLTFSITATSELRGFDLLAGCPVDQLHFDLKANGTPAKADEIYLGRTSKATSAVFTQQKSE